MSAKSRPGNKKGNFRPTGQEQYYTPVAVADLVTDMVVSRYPESLTKLWVEPCGGTGRFLDAFAAAGVEHFWSCDTAPQDPRVQARDFLTGELPEVAGAIVVTNPPFGRNHALSVPFFNRAASFASVIAFIVPRSWRRWSVQNRLDRHFHLVADADLRVYYEMPGAKYVNPKDYMRTCIQIWERQPELRPLIKIENRGYITKVSPALADVRLTFVASNCGMVTTDFERVASTMQMFFKARDAGVIEALRHLDYDRFARNVTHIKCVSFEEVLFLLNEHFDAEKQPPR